MVLRINVRYLLSSRRSLDGVLLLDSVDPFLFMVNFSFFFCFVQTIDDRVFPLFDVNFSNIYA